MSTIMYRVPVNKNVAGQIQDLFGVKPVSQIQAKLVEERRREAATAERVDIAGNTQVDTGALVFVFNDETNAGKTSGLSVYKSFCDLYDFGLGVVSVALVEVVKERGKNKLFFVMILEVTDTPMDISDHQFELMRKVLDRSFAYVRVWDNGPDKPMTINPSYILQKGTHLDLNVSWNDGYQFSMS